jgi:subtilisin family serine protease
MVLRSIGADGSGTVADVLTAYAYAARNGARVVNLSFGGDSASRAERDALTAASGVLFVAAAGNDGADNDTTGSFPCNYELVNVVCVGASDRNDALASFSNRGARTVDLAAPGVKVASTYPDGRYIYLDGTSMAAPHVTGVAALALSRAPGLTVSQLRDVLLSSVDAIPALRPVTVTGGRLNAARAVQAAASAPTGGLTAPASGPSATAGSPSPEPSPPATDTPAPAPTAPAPDSTSAAPAPDRSAPTTPEAAAPAVATSAAAAGDRTAPRLTLRAARALRSRTMRARGLRATVNCSESCRLSVSLTLDAATARRLGLRSRRIAVRSATITRAGRRVVVLRLTTAARARLRGSGRATLQVTARDAAGNRHTRSQAVRLRP